MLNAKELHAVEAAFDVFLRYGFARTTMADLAKAAGMSRPALYLVFPGKEEVFQAVVGWMADNLLAEISSTLKGEWPLDRQLAHVMELCVARPYEQVKANPDAQDILALDSQMPALDRAYAKLQAYLAGLLEAPVKRAGLKVSANDVARTLMSAMRGFKLVAADGKELRRLIAVQVALTTAALGREVASPASAVKRPVPAGRRRAAA